MFDTKQVHVGFVVDKMAIGQVSLEVFQFSPVSNIPPVLQTLFHSYTFNMLHKKNYSALWNVYISIHFVSVHNTANCHIFSNNKYWFWLNKVCWSHICQPGCNMQFLGTFAQLQETAPCPHGTTRLPLDGFSWNLIFEYFLKICQEISSFLKIKQE